MSKKRYRVGVYLLDNQRKRVLLYKAAEGPTAGQFGPLLSKLTTRESPMETVRNLIAEMTNLDFEFIGHSHAMPAVLDQDCVRLYPPFHLELTHYNQENDFVDFVYLAQAKASPDFPKQGPLFWFGSKDLDKVPLRVRSVVNHILALTGE